MKNFTLTLTGAAPLLMHNAQLSDPLNRYVKEMKPISGKRNKTEDDHLAMARIEFMGGLYYDADLGPVMPAMNIEACLVEGAKRLKQGKNVERGLQIVDQVTPLAYSGPRDLEGLWGDGESEFIARHSVRVMTSRVMRTRPMFNNWALEVSGIYDEALLDEDMLNEICRNAGAFAGLGDWRPRFGKFTHTLEVQK